MIPRFDLVVRGGTIVTPGHREIADLGVQDGRIAQIGGAMTGEDERAVARATSTRSAAITHRGLSRPSSTRPWT
jgi:dihydroorotase-like cyclic amidohydrolase